jgi:plastocyanin
VRSVERRASCSRGKRDSSTSNYGNAALHDGTSATTDVRRANLQGDYSMTIRNNEFVRDVSVPVGGSVTWTQGDGVAHSVTALDDSFDSGIMRTNQVFSWQFFSTGSYAYHCILHPAMTGVVNVR